MKLFAVFLGGRADKCNIELHDVVFTCAETIEDSYKDLLSKWFGNPNRLHIDSWVELDYIDGYKIELSKSKPVRENKLFFINLGGYDDNKFEELHESMFLVGDNKNLIKRDTVYLDSSNDLLKIFLSGFVDLKYFFHLV